MRPGRSALRARTIPDGRARTMAIAGTPAACARRVSARRAWPSTLVASTTVSRAWARRRSSALWRTPKAVFVTDLVRRVAGDVRAERIRGQDLARFEPTLGEGGLAGPRRTDQHDQ